mmetsp:Transcript_34872/g.42641  ORF Transcript_34872/g.42641 Transcript_34872/m.42641 type:complete len:210 (-) Transcript_34872:1770-2399(-)
MEGTNLHSYQTSITHMTFTITRAPGLKLHPSPSPYPPFSSPSLSLSLYHFPITQTLPNWSTAFREQPILLSLSSHPHHSPSRRRRHRCPRYHIPPSPRQSGRRDDASCHPVTRAKKTRRPKRTRWKLAPCDDIASRKESERRGNIAPLSRVWIGTVARIWRWRGGRMTCRRPRVVPTSAWWRRVLSRRGRGPRVNRGRKFRRRCRWYCH